MRKIIKKQIFRPRTVAAAGGGKGGELPPPPLLPKFMITIFFIFKEKMIFTYENSVKCQIISLLFKEISCENSFVFKILETFDQINIFYMIINFFDLNFLIFFKIF